MAEALSTFDRLNVFQLLNREWREHLTANERDFLLYMIDNTVSYGRLRLRATVDQMLSGTDWGLTPISMSRASIFRALASLREKGAITVTKVRRGVSDYLINLGWAIGMKEPKNKRVKSGGLASPKKSLNLRLKAGSESQIETPKIDSRPTVEEIDSSAAAPQGVTAEELVARIQNKPKVVDGSTDLLTVWQNAHREAFPGEKPPGLSPADKGKLVHFLKRFPNGLEVLQWSIANWDSIMGRQFDWMTKKAPPSRPAPGFILYYATNFADDYAEEQDRQTYWQSDQEERDYRNLKREGLSHDEAMIAVGKLRAGRESRKADTRQDGKTQAELEQLRRELAEARRRTNAGPAPAPEKVGINHGNNPYENGGEIEDLSDLQPWNGDDT